MMNSPVDSGTLGQRLYSYASLDDTTGELSQKARHELQNLVLNGINLLKALLKSVEDWRDEVFSGEVEFSSDRDVVLRQQIGKWIEITEQIVIPDVRRFEEKFGYNAIPCANDLRYDVSKAQDALAKWEEPIVSPLQGFRTHRLSEKAAKKVTDALRNQTFNPTASGN